MKFSVTNFEIEGTLNTVMKGQLSDMFNKRAKKMGVGYSVQPTARFSQKGRHKKAYVNSLCSLCIESIVDTKLCFLAIFSCGHMFH